MNIAYKVVDVKEGEGVFAQVVVEVSFDGVVNGYGGGRLTLVDIPVAMVQAAIEERIQWKLTNEFHPQLHQFEFEPNLDKLEPILEAYRERKAEARPTEGEQGSVSSEAVQETITRGETQETSASKDAEEIVEAERASGESPLDDVSFVTEGSSNHEGHVEERNHA